MLLQNTKPYFIETDEKSRFNTDKGGFFWGGVSRTYTGSGKMAKWAYTRKGNSLMMSDFKLMPPCEWDLSSCRDVMQRGKDFLTLEGGTDMLSRNVCAELPLHTTQYAGRAQILSLHCCKRSWASVLSTAFATQLIPWWRSYLFHAHSGY